MNEIKVQFSGGLGNQLFTYAAFKHFTITYNYDLTLDCSVIERVLGRNADILSFNLDGEKVITRRDVSFAADILNRISWRNSLTRRVFNRNLYPNLSDEFNRESTIRASLNRGFFQSPQYFLGLKERITADFFELKQESDKYRALKNEIRKVEPIALHVRRGDYRGYKESFGLLDVRYFESSVETLVKLYGQREIWLFSDEPELVCEEFKSSHIRISKSLGPLELNPSETLKLMSLAYAQVISNSTFSWWAGALSESQRVIYPDPWFILNEGWLKNNNLELTNWLAHKSEWRP